jgi:hypothetical protein
VLKEKAAMNSGHFCQWLAFIPLSSCLIAACSEPAGAAAPTTRLSMAM